MLLFKEQNSVLNPSELRDALIELTYYNSTNHPNKLASTEWSSTVNITQELSDETGIIKTSIDKVITLVQDALEITVDDFKAYGQYFTQSETEPPIHRDYITGFDPVYAPDHVAILYMSHNGWKSNLEFWEQAHPEIEFLMEEASKPNALVHTTELSQNELVVFNHDLAHRFYPPSWGNFSNDSGLMLILFLQTS